MTDPNGAVVPGAVVTVTGVENNYQYSARTNDVGYYNVGQLLEGEYTLRVESPGFKTFVARGVRLAAQQVRRYDISLDIGTIETTVEVKAGAALIETEKARISDTKTASLIKDLPLNTRSLWSFVGQNPSVTQAASSTATRRFYGSRNNQGDAAVDGITISNGRDGTQISPLVNYVESFEEVKVDLANNTGGVRRPGAGDGDLGNPAPMTCTAPASITTRRRSSSHATRSRSPAAATWCTNRAPTIGGPMVFPHIYNGKNKTFFFFSFETSRGSQLRDVLKPERAAGKLAQGRLLQHPARHRDQGPVRQQRPVRATTRFRRRG